MEPGVGISLPAFAKKNRVTPVGVKGVGDISILSLCTYSQFRLGGRACINTHLAFNCCRRTIVIRVDTDVVELIDRPMYRFSMKLHKSGPLKFIANYRDFSRKVASEFTETSN